MASHGTPPQAPSPQPIRAARPACQIQPSGSPNPGGSHSICQSWEMPPPDAPPGCPPAVGEGGGGLAPSGAPSRPLPRMEAGAGGGRGQPPVLGPAAGLQMCSPDARPQGLPLARKRPPQPPRRGGNGVGGTRDLQLGPAHGAVVPPARRDPPLSRTEELVPRASPGRRMGTEPNGEPGTGHGHPTEPPSPHGTVPGVGSFGCCPWGQQQGQAGT